LTDVACFPGRAFPRCRLFTHAFFGVIHVIFFYSITLDMGPLLFGASLPKGSNHGSSRGILIYLYGRELPIVENRSSVPVAHLALTNRDWCLIFSSGCVMNRD
jgi:hypothetical protein